MKSKAGRKGYRYEQEIVKLEQALKRVEGENLALKTRMDRLQQTTKEIRERYEDTKQDLGLKIQQNTDIIMKLMRFVGYKETKSEQ